MPDVLLSVPHFEQSRDSMCLPACVRMVLAYWGQELSEAEIAKKLGTQTFGTPISNVGRISQLGYQIDFGPLSVEHLKARLSDGRPVIVRVWTVMLEYWQDDLTSHVVVVVGYDDTQVYLNDPALTNAPQTSVWDGFLAAWAEFDETAAVVYPS